MDGYLRRNFVMFIIILAAMPAFCLAAEEDPNRQEAEIGGDDYAIGAIGGLKHGDRFGCVLTRNPHR